MAWWRNTNIDSGGLYSLIVAAAILLFYLIIRVHSIKDGKWKHVTDYVDELNAPSIVLIGVGIIALWLSVRVCGLLSMKYLTVQNYPYNQYEIFNMIAYALAARLCFTLQASIRGEDGKKRMAQIVNAAMQAVLIGIITFLPKYDDSRLASQLGGAFGFVSVLLVMAITLVLLMYVTKRLDEVQPNGTSNI